MNHAPPDFPFYAGEPIALRPAQWAWLMLAVAVGFAALYLPVGAPGSPLLSFVSALLFPAIPLLALRGLVVRHWRALFHRLSLKDFGLALGVALLNIAITMMVGLLVSRLIGANANPAFGLLDHASNLDRLLFALRSLPQLLGEEVLTMLPFLGLLALMKGRLGLSRRAAITVAWLLSGLLFALVHLPTYQWNWAQCLLIIGSARLVLSLAYLWTRNLWVSTLANVLNYWMLISSALLLATLAQPSA